MRYAQSQLDAVVGELRRGVTSLKLMDTLEISGMLASEAAQLVGQAREYIKRIDAEAHEGAVAAFKRGCSWHDVVGAFIQLGWHPYDAELASNKAKRKPMNLSKLPANALQDVMTLLKWVPEMKVVDALVQAMGMTPSAAGELVIFAKEEMAAEVAAEDVLRRVRGQ